MALEDLTAVWPDSRASITALREALAQPQDKGENNDVSAMADVEQNRLGSGAKDGEVAQQQGKWVDLTDVELFKAYTKETGKVLPNIGGSRSELLTISRIVIAKFKEKNTPKVVPQGEPVVYYAYATIKEYEELAGFSVSEAFRAGWNMARTTNSMLGINAAPVSAPKQEPVAKVIRNESGQISMQKPDGTYFDMSKHIGQTLYTTPPTAAQAARQMKDTIVDIIKTSNTLSEAFNAIAALPIEGEEK